MMKRFMMGLMMALVALALCVGLIGCREDNPSADEQQQAQQETTVKAAVASVGMPVVKNFREKRLVKDIIELRDQDGLTTYTYLMAEATGKLIYVGESVGYGIPYATQFTNPQKIDQYLSQGGYAILPQADPNGLFTPSSAEGTWVMMKDPNGKSVKPVYFEPKVIVSPFKLNQ